MMTTVDTHLCGCKTRFDVTQWRAVVVARCGIHASERGESR